tara:strand:- start:1812 stop:2102 length:291 start_codon:yes stop_codon:yes gene_type:complete
MFRRPGAPAAALADLARLEGLVRGRFRVPETEIVLVSEDAGARPGFPARETNVIFWKDAKRYRLKIFSPVSDVTDADLPVGWLLPSLIDNGDADCC